MKLCESYETPYKPLFAIGVSNALAGLWLWALFGAGIIAYPRIIHAELMVFGFLLSFATGFLMTAIPRFLDSKVCQVWEMGVALLLSLTPLLGLFFPFGHQATWIFGLLQILWIVVYGGRRFLSRKFSPPPSFIFLPVGLLLGLLGCVALLVNPESSAKPLVLEGMMLAFIFGIGSKLLKALLGWEKPILIQLEENKIAPWQKMEFWYGIEALIFLAAGGFHFFARPLIGDLLWALIGTSLAIRNWKIYKRPRTTGSLSLCLFISVWFSVLGLWANVFFSEFRLHSVHFLYISGMTLMTLLVATRVILSHGGHSLELETKSKTLKIISFLMIGAMATRVSAPLMKNAYTTHLTYAVYVLSFAILLWVFGVLKYIVQKPTKT